LRKTLAQQSCLQLKGPVRRYRPDAEAPDAPCGSPSFRSVNGIPCASDPGCKPAQRKFRTSRMPSRADVRSEFFLALVMFTRMEPSRRSIPALVEPGQGRGFGVLTLSRRRTNISRWASPCRPPWLRCYLSRALVRIAGARMRAVLTLGRVDMRDQLDVAARAF
jgi:hypothetical protein